MSKRDSEYLKRSNMTNWHSFIPSIMTARQQSLTGKRFFLFFSVFNFFLDHTSLIILSFFVCYVLIADSEKERLRLPAV